MTLYFRAMWSLSDRVAVRDAVRQRSLRPPVWQWGAPLRRVRLYGRRTSGGVSAGDRGQVQAFVRRRDMRRGLRQRRVFLGRGRLYWQSSSVSQYPSGGSRGGGRGLYPIPPPQMLKLTILKLTIFNESKANRRNWLQWLLRRQHLTNSFVCSSERLKLTDSSPVFS